MTEYDDGELAIGISVDIQRTDGRVHSAILSGINDKTRVVTVEWYEKGEVKGKEIELEAIFRLNPNLRQTVPSNGVGDTGRIHPVKEQQNIGNSMASSRPQSIVGSTNPPVNMTASTTCVSRLLPMPTRVPIPSRLPTSSALSRATTMTGVAQARSSPSHSNQPADTTQTNYLGVSCHQRVNNVFEPMDEDVEISDSMPDTLQQLEETDRDQIQGDWAMDLDGNDVARSMTTDAYRRNPARLANANTSNVDNLYAAGTNGSSIRKSNCVKEIERIQQRREERRAAHKAVRDQLDLDPSNPSYDFYMMIQEYRNTLDYRPLTVADTIEVHQICVCVRKRPMNKKELARREIDVITVPNKQHLLVHEPKTKVDLTKYLENQQFRFDYAFDDSSDNELVYHYTAKPLVESIFQRGMATCFAYGQTGSGKTHTMGGEFQSRGQQNCCNGIYALAANDVFNLNATTYKHENLQVEAAFFEIYSGKVFDLLNKKAKLRVLEDAKGQVQIVGLREEQVRSVDCVLKLLQHGAHIRTSGQTSANQHSSRSHAVFQLILKKQSTNKIFGKFSLIDLAGNERGVDTSSSDRHTRMEGAEINKSLLALKECIRALGRRGAHLPFRASKLTQVLRDSFIGDRSRTCMIAMISPGMTSCEHTLNTLRYADRVKELGPGNLAEESGVPDSTLAPSTNQVPNSSRVGSRLPPSESTGKTAYSTTMVTGAGAGFTNINDADKDDNLAVLRLASQGEMAEELFQIQQVIEHIRSMEDEVCLDHKSICTSMANWIKEHHLLHKMSNSVEFDVDDYSARLETLLTKQLKALSALKDKITLWRREMRQEEELSTKLQHSRKF